ncbi:MAG: hypothetical protein K2O97_09140, partial [Acetatifactor sp.]|nr:hypothetical protein [Acetatifactor sp.]
MNKELARIKKVNDKTDIYWLVIEVEKRLDMYSDWQNRGVIYSLDPLNKNVKATGIVIYVRISPAWNTDKSERNRERRLNAGFTNYMMMRT